MNAGTLDKLERKEFTGEEISRALDNEVKIIEYTDLLHIDTLDDLLKPFNKTVILYQSDASNIGHWTCIFKQDPQNVIFFDSYGFKYDDEIKYCDYLKREMKGKKLLTYLIDANETYNIAYNKRKYQKMAKNDNCCGRYVIIRLLNSKLNNTQFHDRLQSMSKKMGLTNDEVVSLLTSPR